jgi:hypothetical protein
MIKKTLLAASLVFTCFFSAAENRYPDISSWQSVLGKSYPGDTVFFPNEKLIVDDITTFTIPRGVTLKTQTGTIKCNYFAPELDYVPLFVMEAGSSMIGMTLMGANGEVGESGGVTVVQNAIKTVGEDCRIIGCVFLHFDKWAVWAYDPSGLLVQNCRFENIRREGYGYGVWVGGRGGVFPKMAVIDNNTFINCRSAVDGSGGYYSFTVQNNIFGEQQTYSTVARHGQGGSIKGGIKTFIFGNIVLNPVNRNLEIPIPAVDTGLVWVQNNMFTRTNGCWIGDTTMERAATKYPNVKVSTNSFSPTYDLISFSIKDTYNNFTPNKLKAKLQVNNSIVWEVDLAGDNMDWKKYYVNITRFLVTGTNTITFLFESDTATASKIYLDNIVINRIPGANTSFENSSDSWRLTPSGFGSRFVTEEFFDKIYSLRIQAPENKATATLRYTFKK